ncbi:fatty acid hydroperoxide lyase, chloroplastic [Telopea speciosissima]|uniref:fatty acid hydroperoxide lyase, chloroplastic n=1 Tax=Telopea speciosissima TaxID=54955 RepID=UPI001CC5508F|nr:fatty acid hydroperoxide lyase, chloroplastic [Telopea speciosissima]XP_043688834.1 fatty acid hydroperoxide lyase, chloroplastic [Telopea speciosissima]
MAAMVTQMMTSLPRMSSSSVTPPIVASPTPSALPVRAIPGSYGLPLVGPFLDRLDYFWFQGPETFFRKRLDKYKSTVFRTNIPPTFPFFTSVNPKVVAVLDCKSFSNLFDMEAVEKKDILIGDFMPSLSFTGNIRVGVYLDTSEPKHTQLKNFSLDILKRSSSVWVSEFLSNLDIMWGTVETGLAKNGSSSLIVPLQKCIFRFFTKTLAGADATSSSEIADYGFAYLDKWLALQIIPTQKIGILQPFEEIFLHSFSYPSILVSSGYQKLYDFLKKEGMEVIQRGETEFGLTEDETIHNLLFVLGFNAFGGFSVFLPGLISTLGSDETGLQKKLREEVREKLGSTQKLSFESIKEMELVQSFVYESLRYSPPVPFQYARARKDFVLSSHDSSYEIKKGELLCGYQLLAMRDEKIFSEPEKFVADRFTGEKGRELLKYLYWSNGPQTGSPSASNKQCAAKDIVVLTASLFVADLFRRYDSFSVSSLSLTAVEKAK